MYEKIAKRIVNESLSVNKKDAVVINTWQHTIDFADALALECRKIGADVMVTLSTDKTFYGVVQDLPNEHVKTPAKLTLGLLDAETIEINISGPEDPSFLKKIDPEKFLLLQERNSPVNEKFRDRKIRAASCALGSVTPQRAKTYGLDFNVWKNEMNAALDVDYRAMNEFGTKLADKLEKTQEVHIKAPSGTDLKFEIQGRPVHILDGVVDQDDISKASFLTDLPAGYVILAPIETSANGKVIFDLPQAVQG
ncbi:MAG: aminopeptidase, partial [Candidatus Hermodarchaeota archaeon]